MIHCLHSYTMNAMAHAAAQQCHLGPPSAAVSQTHRCPEGALDQALPAWCHQDAMARTAHDMHNRHGTDLSARPPKICHGFKAALDVPCRHSKLQSAEKDAHAKHLQAELICFKRFSRNVLQAALDSTTLTRLQAQVNRACPAGKHLCYSLIRSVAIRAHSAR